MSTSQINNIQDTTNQVVRNQKNSGYLAKEIRIQQASHTKSLEKQNPQLHSLSRQKSTTQAIASKANNIQSITKHDIIQQKANSQVKTTQVHNVQAATREAYIQPISKDLKIEQVGKAVYQQVPTVHSLTKQALNIESIQQKNNPKLLKHQADNIQAATQQTIVKEAMLQKITAQQSVAQTAVNTLAVLEQEFKSTFYSNLLKMRSFFQ